VRIGRGGRGRRPPVDADGTFNLRGGRGVAADHERGVPVPETVPIDADTGRLRRQLSGPEHGDAHPGWQAQATVSDRETARGVVQRGKSQLVGLELRTAPVFDLERVAQREAVSPQDLLLGNLRPFTQPNQPAPGLRKQFAQSGEVWALPGLLHVDGFVPQEPAPVPLREQRDLRLPAGAQTVGVTHCLDHDRNISAGTDTNPPVARSRPLHRRPYLPTTKARGFTGALR